MAGPVIEWRIMAHPKRRAMAEALAVYLEGTITWDLRPGGPPSAWRTARRAWRRRAVRSHVGVIQDDALPVPGFRDRAEIIVEHYPDAMIAFYLGDGHHSTPRYLADAAGGNDVHTLIDGHFVPTVCLAMPAWMAREVATREPDCPHDDEVIGRWRSEHGITCLVPIPLLCDHNVHAPTLLWHDPDYPQDRHAVRRLA